MSACAAHDYRVLIADNDLGSRDSLAFLLHKEGFRTLPCDGGCAAFEVLARQVRCRSWSGAGTGSASGSAARAALDPGEEVHFLVLDYNMPDLTGLDVLRRLRSELNAEFPSIVVSGELTVTLEHSMRELGVFAWIPKPIQPAFFREQIWHLVRHRLVGRS